ncbi:hypothetical protein SS50377_25085 [Spironucleus salmonicida]|uniref:Uncharacterized protein n=1 Tax=Spironucleus salmonicida TaxID=348837 RepID=V6LEL0_9EUKA|nr:hypothetical protein SS50377_25085 [Spironucleus salmonicida]|eukprot:EST42955.1 Hypothetical protein SS50377_17404 [Spironucleus salmonicida]
MSSPYLTDQKLITRQNKNFIPSIQPSKYTVSHTYSPSARPVCSQDFLKRMKQYAPILQKLSKQKAATGNQSADIVQLEREQSRLQILRLLQ